MTSNRGMSDIALRQKLLDVLGRSIERIDTDTNKPVLPHLRNAVRMELSWIDKEAATPVIAQLRETPSVISVLDSAKPGEFCVEVIAPFRIWKNLLEGDSPIIPFNAAVDFSSASKPAVLAELARNRRISPWKNRFPLLTRPHHHDGSVFSHMKIG